MVKNMKRYMMSVSDEMYQDLEKERKDRRLETVQEVTRQIVSDYLRQKNVTQLQPSASDILRGTS
jgi:metal-responsive CopG/Arc/MetJ family transcriptional regulator